MALAYLHGIKCCEAHDDMAARDINAYYHARQLVKLEPFLHHFPQLQDLKDIKVPRSDGSVSEGGSFVKSSFEDYRFVRRTSAGDWMIRVTWAVPDDTMTKDMKVQDLALSGIDVEPIMALLNAGFYKEDYDKQQVAKTTGTLSEEHQAAAVMAPLTEKGLVHREFVPGMGPMYVASNC